MKTAGLIALLLMSALSTADETSRLVASSWFDRPESTPKGLNRTYDALMSAFYLGNREDILKHALSGSVRISEHKRKPAHTGEDINLLFLKNGFSNLVLSFDMIDDQTVRIRTRTSILHFVRTADQTWKLYRYRDEPVTERGSR